MDERERLIEQHLGLVQALAGKLKRQLGGAMTHDDLVGYGAKGLVEAANRFDPTQGATFVTFAYYRIRGAMLDGMRAMGWYSRADYARYRAEERANDYLQTAADQDAADRAAAPAGAADKPDAARTLESVAATLSDIATIHITSLEAASSVADQSAPAADDTIALGQLSGRVREAVKGLPDKERQLVEMYYFGGKNLEEAGAVMGLSKSWACRLHARAVKLLRAAIED